MPCIRVKCGKKSINLLAREYSVRLWRTLWFFNFYFFAKKIRYRYVYLDRNHILLNEYNIHFRYITVIHDVSSSVKRKKKEIREHFYYVKRVKQYDDVYYT